LQEINHYLAEGLECKDILVLKNEYILHQDEVIHEQAEIISDQKKQMALLQENYTIAGDRAAKAMKELDKSEKERVRLKKGRNFWRTVASIEAAALAALGLLL